MWWTPIAAKATRTLPARRRLAAARVAVQAAPEVPVALQDRAVLALPPPLPPRRGSERRPRLAVRGRLAGERLLGDRQQMLRYRPHRRRQVLAVPDQLVQAVDHPAVICFVEPDVDSGHGSSPGSTPKTSSPPIRWRRIDTPLTRR